MSHTPSEGEREPLVTLVRSMDESSGLSLLTRFKRAWRKPMPVWIAPVVLAASLCRGMTMAPRVDVYTRIACRALELENATGSAMVPAANAFSALSSLHGQPLDLDSDSDGEALVLSIPGCTANPNQVQARAARIQASVKTTESILSAITTGWLAHQSDIYGRKILLVISIFGALFMDFVYILVSSSSSDTIFTRHGEGFIIAAPLVEGLLGAQSTFSGLTHAYASDCSGTGSRSQLFVMMQGMLYVGLAVGPWINGAILNLIPGTNNETLFAASIGIALVHLVFITFVLPESLPPHQRFPSVDSTLTATRSEMSPGGTSRERKISGSRFAKRVAHFFKALLIKPIAILFPQPVEGTKGRDWNVTLAGLALFIYVLSIQVYNLKYLYVKHVYGWNSEYLGYYMSLLFVTRAITLLFILPSVLAYFSPPRPEVVEGVTPNLAPAIRFDRAVTAISFFTDATANMLVVLSPTSSQALFIFFTSLNSITSGGNPALHSLASVSLQAMGKGVEVGLLFGALGLINSASHVVAPGIYAVIYGATVATFPKAMFLLSGVLLYLAVTALLGVRPDVQSRPHDGEYQYEPAQNRDSMDSGESALSLSDGEDELATTIPEQSDGSPTESRMRGRRGRRSTSRSTMSPDDIDRARHASLARLSFSENT